MRITFEEIKKTRNLKLTCQTCGKLRRRVISASCTVNPFNKNPDGSVRSREEVHQQVREKLEEYVAEALEKQIDECGPCGKKYRP